VAVGVSESCCYCAVVQVTYCVLLFAIVSLEQLSVTVSRVCDIKLCRQMTMIC